MISAIEDYFTKGCGRCDRFATSDCSTRLWGVGLAQLRRICLSAGLEETVKWGHPCYIHQNRNVALIGAFRDDFRLTMMNAALLSDADHLLERPGPNTGQANMIRFTDVAQVHEREPAISGMLDQAIGNVEAGRRAPRSETEPDLPPELVAALDADPEMAEAFAALTRGRRRSYVIALSSARSAATRISRIAKLRDPIMAGKGATER